MNPIVALRMTFLDDVVSGCEDKVRITLDLAAAKPSAHHLKQKQNNNKKNTNSKFSPVHELVSLH
jgi:hypothetical protein